MMGPRKSLYVHAIHVLLQIEEQGADKQVPVAITAMRLSRYFNSRARPLSVTSCHTQLFQPVAKPVAAFRVRSFQLSVQPI